MTQHIVLSENPRGRFQEATLATAAIKPGTFVKVSDTDVSGNYSDPYLEGGAVRRQTVTRGFAGEVLVATQAGLMGGAVDVELPVNSNIHYYIPLPGDEFFAMAKAGEALNAGARATIDANGLLVASATGILVVQEDGGTIAAGGELVIVRMGASNAATV